MIKNLFLLIFTITSLSSADLTNFDTRQIVLQDVKKIYEYNGKDYNENIENLLNVYIPFGMKIPDVEGQKVENSVSKIS